MGKIAYFIIILIIFNSINMAVIKLAGEDITQNAGNLSIDLSVGNHSRFTLNLSNEDRVGAFKGILSEASKKWIGKKLEVDDIFKGVVTSVNLSRARGGGSFFIIYGESPTIHLDDGTYTRSFGEKTLQQILDEVMKPYQSKFDDTNIKAKYGKIKYCVQNRESNFFFINRLSARYGEWFYYDGLKLVFGKPPSGSTIDLSFVRDITHFNISVKTRPVNFKIKTYDYKKHDFPQKQSSYASPSNPYAKIAFDKSKNDIYPNTPSVPINLSMNESDLDQIVTLRQNVHLNEMVILTASSTKQELKIGSIVKIVDTRDELDAGGTDDYGEYVITRITHEISSQGTTYTNHFEAIPKDAAIPPLSISPDPPPCEMQTAEVVDNNDPKGMGRVRVQFLWQKDLSGNDAKTPWIRVASPQGGGSKGFYILPEIDDQVLVAFEHSHPERPYVLTGMYHGKAKPQHSHGENNKKAIKTKGGIEILMNDEKGKETFTVTSPMDVTINATGGKITVTAKGDIIIQSSTGNVTISAPNKIKMEAADIILEAKSSISLKAMKITEKGDVSVNIEAPQLALEGKATASLKGAMVEVNGTGMTNIQGGMIKLN
jgi:type VI secretion system secreted protein VgrG